MSVMLTIGEELIELEPMVIRKLWGACTANQASQIFDKHAPHVPARLRPIIWRETDHFSECDLQECIREIHGSKLQPNG
jgi:hypothetical protein